jgi:hypothetical protein
MSKRLYDRPPLSHRERGRGVRAFAVVAAQKG